MLNAELELTLNQAFNRANDERHEFMTVEHLLYALTENPSAAEVLLSCGAQLDELRKQAATALPADTMAMVLLMMVAVGLVVGVMAPIKPKGAHSTTAIP